MVWVSWAACLQSQSGWWGGGRVPHTREHVRCLADAPSGGSPPKTEVRLWTDRLRGHPWEVLKYFSIGPCNHDWVELPHAYGWNVESLIFSSQGYMCFINHPDNWDGVQILNWLESSLRFVWLERPCEGDAVLSVMQWLLGWLAQLGWCLIPCHPNESMIINKDQCCVELGLKTHDEENRRSDIGIWVNFNMKQ